MLRMPAYALILKITKHDRKFVYNPCSKSPKADACLVLELSLLLFACVAGSNMSCQPCTKTDPIASICNHFMPYSETLFERICQLLSDRPTCRSTCKSAREFLVSVASASCLPL